LIAMGWTAGVRFPTGVNSFLFSIASIVHQFSYVIATVGLFPGVDRSGREVDHSPPPTAEVKNGGALPPLPHMS
jgi:hypothetical protein